MCAYSLPGRAATSSVKEVFVHAGGQCAVCSVLRAVQRLLLDRVVVRLYQLRVMTIQAFGGEEYRAAVLRAGYSLDLWSVRPGRTELQDSRFVI